MARSSEYIYDNDLGIWTESVSYSDGSGNNGSNNSDNLTSSNSDKNSSTGSVEKEYNDIEINTLSGTLNFIVTAETIKLKAGDTVNILGIGKYLSGSYYVKDLTRQIGSDGYSHSATLIKTDFGNSLKITSSAQKVNQKTTPSSSQASSAKRTHTVRKGECLWGIARHYYGNGALYTKIYDANTNQIADPKLIYIGQVLIIP